MAPFKIPIVELFVGGAIVGAGAVGLVWLVSWAL